ncbi:MAG TPA: hypothetical protein PKE47_17350, partial [Verrucomicrobiota bacterium]|nr:hypothetical protein [Verrucomicrobiota bacterium]
MSQKTLPAGPIFALTFPEPMISRPPQRGSALPHCARNGAVAFAGCRSGHPNANPLNPMMFQRDRGSTRWTRLLAGWLALLGFAVQAQTQFTPGFVKVELYTGIGGTAVANLTSNAKFPDSPDEVRFVKFAGVLALLRGGK